MVRSKFTFLSADGKTPIHAVVWEPETAPVGVVQLSHGVAEHIGRYEPLARFLTEHGFAVAGHDHLGHGASILPGAPGCTSAPGAAGCGRRRTCGCAGSISAPASPASPISFWVTPWAPSWPGRI